MEVSERKWELFEVVVLIQESLSSQWDTVSEL